MFCTADTAPGDDMDFHLQPHAAHAQRLLDAFLPVDAELLLEDVQDLLVARQADRARCFHRTNDVGVCHFLVFDLDHAVGIGAADVAARNAGIDIAYLAVRHQLGLFQRALDGADRGVDVHHHALLHAG